MADYAVGDIQGCFEPLLRLLDHIHYSESEDRLWFVGDLVNRGPQSLDVLRFIKGLAVKPVITLGNHDLSLLARLFTDRKPAGDEDTLKAFFKADDRDELGHWLRKQHILYEEPSLNILATHAGIAPCWDLNTAKACAYELERTLSGDDYGDFFSHMYGNKPDIWSSDLAAFERLRVITNYFTRMRFCDTRGRLLFDYKGTIKNAPVGYIPWFEVPGRHVIESEILFGHWAALEKNPRPGLWPIDTGCIWGGQLTALRLQDRKLFSVQGLN